MVAMVKQEQMNEMKESLLLDGLKNLIFQISGQNTEKMSKIVETLKTKKEMSSTEMRPALVTKPAKVPSWTINLSLETYVKQIET